MKRHKRPQDDSEINITPMLDVVFILLIFFIVTTSFVRESGLDISRPTQNPDEQQQDEDQRPILVRIDSTSKIIIEDRTIDRFAIRVNLERLAAQRPEAPLIIAAHEDAMSEMVVAVIDAANLVNIQSVNLATER
jgi:biopolymer transport protein ExbD